MTYRLTLLVTLGLTAITSILFSLFTGTVTIDFHQWIVLLTQHDNSLLQKIIFSIRLPRVLSAFVTGGLLALAGALMQILLRNPLADPYVLGVSGGAAVVTLLLIIAGFSGYALTGGAWFGSLLAIGLMLLLVTPQKMGRAEYLLLTGIAIASGFSAVISLILLTSPEHELRSMLFWLIGDLSYTHSPLLEFFILLFGLIVSFSLARELNILARGEKEAKSLGVNVNRLQLKLFLLSSLLTATAVTLAGCIGFIGLIVPHCLRLIGGYDHRFLLPACVLLGGTLLTIADTLSRTLFDPLQLPVGIVMIMLGIPVFLILLQKKYS